MVKFNLEGINRIVAFGCSFTAGAEILDHTLDDKYVKSKPVENAFVWYENINKDPIASEKLFKNRQEEKYLAWPAKLAKELKLDFISYADVGNSNERMVWQIENAIQNGEILPTDLVLVGLTSPHRTMQFDLDRQGPVAILLSHPTDVKTKFGKFLYKWFDDGRIIWNYIRDIESFNFIKRKLNNRLFVVLMEPRFSVGTGHYYGLNNLGHQTKFFEEKIDEIFNSDLFIGDDNYLYKFCLKDEEKLEHGHPAEKAHQLFANALVPYFIKNT